MKCRKTSPAREIYHSTLKTQNSKLNVQHFAIDDGVILSLQGLPFREILRQSLRMTRVQSLVLQSSGLPRSLRFLAMTVRENYKTSPAREIYHSTLITQRFTLSSGAERDENNSNIRFFRCISYAFYPPFCRKVFRNRLRA